MKGAVSGSLVSRISITDFSVASAAFLVADAISQVLIT
jgi:hypothetical protein